MQSYLKLCFALIFGEFTLATSRKIICNYNASSLNSQGLAQFTLGDLENALEFCTHILYGHAGIHSLCLRNHAPSAAHDVQQLREVMALKTKYPRTKFLLSLGGNKDTDVELTHEYLELLEGGVESPKLFIDSVVACLRHHKFDGLDLAAPFPRNNNIHTRRLHVPWNSVTNLRKIKMNAARFREVDLMPEFLALMESLKEAFKPHGLMLSLTVHPNVNSSAYFNASALTSHLDFINLQTFDFTTPELNPTEATYTAPLYSIPVQGHSNVQHNVDYQVNFWISKRFPINKINIGIAAYGQAWRMTKQSKSDGFPKVFATDGPAPDSYITNVPGIVTWSEICVMLPNMFNANRTGDRAPLTTVLDPHNNFATYAFRPADGNGAHGMWISYDDPRIAAIKAQYVKQRRLGGITLYDVNLDDFRGVCNGDTFPMLRYIKYMFT